MLRRQSPISREGQIALRSAHIDNIPPPFFDSVRSAQPQGHAGGCEWAKQTPLASLLPACQKGLSKPEHAWLALLTLSCPPARRIGERSLNACSTAGLFNPLSRRHSKG